MTLNTTHFVEAGNAVRAFLCPLWMRIHEADRTWNRIRDLPEIPSTALCRHTCLFTQRVFASVGQTRWRIASGHVLRSAMPVVPEYVGDADLGRHCWLAHPDHGLLDLAADQFGQPPTIAGDASADAFHGHIERDERVPVKNLKRTILNWEGDPAGTWNAEDLESQRSAYRSLRSAIAKTLSKPS